MEAKPDAIDIQIEREEKKLARLRERRRRIRARDAAGARQASERCARDVGQAVVAAIGDWKEADPEAVRLWAAGNGRMLAGLSWNGDVTWQEARDRLAAWEAHDRERRKGSPDPAEADAAEAEAFLERSAAMRYADAEAEVASLRPWLLPALRADPERFKGLLRAKREAADEAALTGGAK